MAKEGKAEDEHCNMAMQTNKIFLSNLQDFVQLLLDSGATSHFTPVLNDLIEPVKLNKPLNIKSSKWYNSKGNPCQGSHYQLCFRSGNRSRFAPFESPVCTRITDSALFN